MLKKLSKQRLFPIVLVVSLLFMASFYFLKQPVGKPIIQELTKPSEESFLAPSRDWESEKKVEDYFIEHLRMSPQEAQEVRSKPGSDGTVMLRIRETTNLEALLSNLEYYGFVRDKEALRYALEHTEDNQVGKANPIMVGENTISTWSSYRISEDMTAWEIADQLLNHPTYFAFDEYNYLFMP